MLTLGFDIGGANLKAANSTGRTAADPFEIWRAPQELPARLTALAAKFPPADQWAVTMTAELADCFATKAEGVRSILQAVRQAADSIPIRVWTTSAEFLNPAAAADHPHLVAAANWHALATWAGRFAPEGQSLLLDIGSTTTDIIPLRDGVPCSSGLTDVERLLAGELVYTGCRRTPLCAVAPTVAYRGRTCSVAAELFATMLDVYLILGNFPEDPNDRHTADGRPATIPCAHDRLARMICCDRTEFDASDADLAARYFAGTQQKTLHSAVDKVLRRLGGNPQTAILTGSGTFLIDRLLDGHPVLRQASRIRLSDKLSPALAESACAYAVSVLAGEGNQ